MVKQKDKKVNSDGECGQGAEEEATSPLEKSLEDEIESSDPANASAILVGQVRGATTLLHDEDDVTYAWYEHEDHTELWRLDSPQFKRWACRLLYCFNFTVIGSGGFADARTVLEGEALFEGEKREVFLRAAKVGARYYLDLCNAEWQCIRVDESGWKIIDSTKRKIPFRRTSTMSPLPNPKRTTYKRLPGLLKPHLNVDEGDLRLCIAFLLEVLMPDTEYPIMELSGPPGSGKSTVQDMLRQITDPNSVNLRAAPKSVQDIFVSATNNHVTSYNNLSKITPAESDALCCLSTGGGFASRALFTDGDENSYTVKKPVMFNGVAAVAKQPDLIDRLIHVKLLPISEGDNRSKRDVEESFAADLPMILGSLLNLFSKVLVVLPDTQLKHLPRMADFALLCRSITTVYGWKVDLLDVYYKKRAMAFQDSIEASPIMMALVTFVTKEEGYSGTVGNLYNALTADKMRGEGWVKSARGLSSKIRMYTPALNSIGIKIKYNPIKQNTGRQIKILVKK